MELEAPGNTLSPPDILACVAFSLIVTWVPWSDFANVGTSDFQNYVLYIRSMSLGVDYSYRFESYISILTNEYLWHSLSRIIAISGIEAEKCLALISMICAFCFAILTIKLSGTRVALLFLLNPLIIGLVNGQVRSAVAACLFMFGFTATRRSVRIFLTIAAPMIHASMALAFIFAILVKYIGRVKLRISKKYSVYLATGILAALIVSFGYTEVLDAIGDRRAVGYAEVGSLKYSIFWVIYAVMIAFFSGVGLLRATSAAPAAAFSVVVLAFSSVSTILGFYGIRFVAMFFPVVLGATFGIRGKEGALVASILYIYILLSWSFFILA